MTPFPTYFSVVINKVQAEKDLAATKEFPMQEKPFHLSNQISSVKLQCAHVLIRIH